VRGFLARGGLGIGVAAVSFGLGAPAAAAAPPVVIVLPSAAPLARVAAAQAPAAGPSGGGGGFFVQTWWSLPAGRPRVQSEVLTEGELLEEESSPMLLSTLDVQGLAERVATETERGEVQAWGKAYRGKSERARATEMLEAVRTSFYAAAFGSTLAVRTDFAVLLAAGYTAAGLHAAVLAHAVGFVEDVLVAVYVDKAWQHADPFHGLPLGSALPYRTERFATVPRIPDPVVLTPPVVERVVEVREVPVEVRVERIVEVPVYVTPELAPAAPPIPPPSRWWRRLFGAGLVAGLFAIAWALWRKRPPRLPGRRRRAASR
jgi:hypothetical protein